jgi:hypothetical protein
MFLSQTYLSSPEEFSYDSFQKEFTPYFFARLYRPNQGCQIFLGPSIPKYENIPKDHKLHQTAICTLYQMAVKYTKIGRKIYQHFTFQGPQKYTQILIFGLKINHLVRTTASTFHFISRLAFIASRS